MSQLSEIEPKEKPNLIELVKKAGINVSDWANYKRGKKWAAANPKYCYEWSFFKANKVVVLNLWYHLMDEMDGAIIIRQNMNMREIALVSKGNVKKRAQEFDCAIQMVINGKLPIRAVICGRNPAKPSKVSKRLLDCETWAVTAYDWKNGQCVLTRGIHQKNVSITEKESAVDDLSEVPEGNRFPDGAKVIAKIVKRDDRVRAYALKRAKGKCEYCNVQGFPTTNGGFYIEAHHIIALCDSGQDTVENIIALCPQHHRQAHYGVDGESLEAKFINILKKLNSA